MAKIIWLQVKNLASYFILNLDTLFLAYPIYIDAFSLQLAELLGSFLFFHRHVFYLVIQLMK